MSDRKALMKASTYSWVKTFHLIFSTLWLGSSVALFLALIWLRTVDGIVPYWVLKTLDFIDWFVLVPGATGVVVTGVIFSLKSKWGWGRAYFWIRAKWLISLLSVIVGTFYLAPWLHTMINLAQAKGISVYYDPDYASISNWLFFWAFVQIVSLIYAVYLSIFKPRFFRPQENDSGSKNELNHSIE